MRRRLRSHARLSAATLAAAALLLGACGDEETTTTTDTTGATTTADGPDVTTTTGGADGTPEAPAGTGTVAVRLEQVDGVFIEGFEVGLRFDGADGTELDRVLWSDFVRSLGSTEMEAFYDSVLEQTVPAGTVTVGADVRIGMGPGPEAPDLGADALPCELEVEVPEGGRVEVEVSFDGTADCLAVVG